MFDTLCSFASIDGITSFLHFVEGFRGGMRTATQ